MEDGQVQFLVRIFKKYKLKFGVCSRGHCFGPGFLSSDLFWALRGAGNGSYGIVLGFTFKMHYVPVVTYYELMWEWDINLVKPIMETWQPWAEDLPDSVTSVLGIRHPNYLCAVPRESP